MSDCPPNCLTPLTHAPDAHARQEWLAAKNRAVSIVVEDHVLRPPIHDNRETRCQANATRRFQALRPLLHGAQSGARPIHCSHPLGHFTAADQEIGRVASLEPVLFKRTIFVIYLLPSRNSLLESSIFHSVSAKRGPTELG